MDLDWRSEAGLYSHGPDTRSGGGWRYERVGVTWRGEGCLLEYLRAEFRTCLGSC